MKNKEVAVGDSLESLFSLTPSNCKEIDAMNKKPPFDQIIALTEEQEERLALRQIHISSRALHKMFFMAKEVIRLFNEPLEVYALAVGNSEVIEDILIPRQMCSHTSIHINAKDLLSLMPEIQKQDVNVLGWTHSHANFSVFFSGTDTQNQKTILAETSNFRTLNGSRVKFCYGLTVNIHQDVFGMVSTQFSSGKIYSNQATLEIHSSPNDGVLSDFEEAALSQILRDHIHILKSSSQDFKSEHC
ncbi:hypothetical protein NEF87_003304 [Candidatus Lokiarchaeum ossiferum]|uniref:JAB domain-containing protein n=1 Tax=Candidatus Lokiarchaeum ossiferum TaxID=2951803 RepID=A0ABY6HU27_9ARCH|nr:hypothetical protein NEF87_003304 [Candidatus Lokiarchaeum sp. B-35]